MCFSFPRVAGFHQQGRKFITIASLDQRGTNESRSSILFIVPDFHHLLPAETGLYKFYSPTIDTMRNNASMYIHWELYVRCIPVR